jgi:hemoglobin-like flavoprotein
VAFFFARPRPSEYRYNKDNKMLPAQKKLVQESFAKVAPIADQAAALFYQRLFELDPSLKGLFIGDMQEQGRKLMAMIGFAVNGLDQLDQLVPAVQDLGRRHAQYGVEDAHYNTVAEALLWTLRQGLGSAFTAETEEAWATAYGVLATTMKQAAAERPIDAPV